MRPTQIASRRSGVLQFEKLKRISVNAIRSSRIVHYLADNYVLESLDNHKIRRYQGTPNRSIARAGVNVCIFRQDHRPVISARTRGHGIAYQARVASVF
jgi:hypothetical protein